MPWLTDERLFEPALPEGLRHVLEGLADLYARNDALRRPAEGAALEGEARAAAVQALRARHDDLMNAARASLPPSDTVSREAAIRPFASGVLRALRYRETVLGDRPLLDTCGSKTLAAFSTDLLPGDAPVVRDALRRAFDLSASDLAALDAEIAPELEQLDARRSVTSALAARFPADTPEDRAALFRALYPDSPLRPGDVELIWTSTMCFFCLPIDGERLTNRRCEGAEAEAIAAFLGRLAEFQQGQLAHFPSFGVFRAGDAHAALIAALSEDTGLPGALVSECLTTTTVILPAAEVDKYIVHDAWGHTWQALLYGFEDSYRRTAGHAEPPGPEDAPLGGPGALALAICGDPSGWDDWIRAACVERLYDALSGLTAEVLADVVEYKYLALRPGDAALMPSSSFVKELPTKIDLTLHDLPWYFSMACRGLRRLRRPDQRVALATAIRAAPPPGGAPEDLEARIRAFADRADAWMDRHMSCSISTDPGAVTPFTRAALNYLGLHALFNALYRQLWSRPAPAPLGGPADLLVFCAAAFFEADWRRNFWRLDELLARFDEIYSAFCRALDA